MIQVFANVAALVAFCTALALTGCGTVTQGRVLLERNSAAAADESLTLALFGVCPAASSGAIDRRYGDKPNVLAARDTLCKDFYDSENAPW